MKIIIDHREQKSQVINNLKNLGVDCHIKHLKLGDYVISKEIVIERKTVSDFVGSMINRRLIDQLTDMKKNFKHPLLFVEGIDEDDIYHPSSHLNINENSVRGMLLTIAIEFGIPTIFTKNQEDTARYLYLLLKRQNKPAKEYSLKFKRKSHNLSEQQLIIIESFPGIGPSIAKNLLKYFGSIKNLFNAEIKELTKVKKIGKNKAENIKKIINKNYR